MRGYIEQRGEHSFRVNVYLGKDGNGKDGYYRETVRGLKRDAQKRLHELLVERDSRRLVKPTRLNLADFLHRWLEDYARPRVRVKTFESYEGLARTHILPSLGGIALEDLSPMLIQRFYAEKLSGPRADGKPGRLSPNTVKHLHNLLRQSLKYAVRWGLLSRNPVEMVDAPRVPRRDLPVWSLIEARRFLDAARGHRHYPAFLLALSTGLRRGELLGLRWRDLDLERDLVRVSQSLVSTRKGNIMQLPKTEQSRRLVPIPPELVAELVSRRTEVEAMKEVYAEDYEDKDLIFCQPDGRQLDPRRFTRTFDLLAAKAGLRHIPFHGLRHTHATLLFGAGVPLKIISERLGHTETGTTADIYVQVMPPEQRRATDAISALLFGDGRRAAYPTHTQDPQNQEARQKEKPASSG